MGLKEAGGALMSAYMRSACSMDRHTQSGKPFVCCSFRALYLRVVDRPRHDASSGGGWVSPRAGAYGVATASSRCAVSDDWPAADLRRISPTPRAGDSSQCKRSEQASRLSPFQTVHKRSVRRRCGAPHHATNPNTVKDSSRDLRSCGA
jgi:hypothetical protein